MTVLPVIERELRAQSRLPFTYNLRVIGAAALLLVCLAFSFTNGLGPSLGGELFAHLNFTLFLAIWVLAPLLCADCISRERREGTVGLLFLTPLKARDVVLAKGLVHGLRAFSLLLAVLPMITIALLMGGVSWSDAALSLIMNCSALCWALAAGLLASSVSKTWLRAQLVAMVLVAAFGLVFLLAVGTFIISSFPRGRWIPYASANDFDQFLVVGFISATDFNGSWSRMLGRLPPAAQASWLLAQCRVAIFSIFFLLLIIEAAARNLRRFWRETPPSAQRVWLEQKLFTPVLWVAFLRGWMRRKLERNPIGWLETRTWSGRLVTWGWFAVMISLYSTAFKNAGLNRNLDRSLDILQQFMAWLLLGIVAVSAAGSFQRERETGVLELLLVSPMSVGQIIGGRLRGLWGQFLPAFVLLLGIWLYLSSLFPDQAANFGLIEFYCGAFLALPVIGLYYSLRRSNFISALLSTLFLGLVVPFALKLTLGAGVQFVLNINAYDLSELTRTPGGGSLSMMLFHGLLRFTSSAAFITLLQLLIAVRVGLRLQRDMESRNYAFTRALT